MPAAVRERPHIRPSRKTRIEDASEVNELPIVDIHSVELNLRGYKDGVLPAIEIYEDSVRTIHYTFSRVTYPLKITSDPPGATIYLDGTNYGQTPNSLPSVTHGTHELSLSRKGFRRFRRRINVPVSNNLVEITLTRLPPGKFIFSIYPYANIYIDGELKAEGVMNFQIELEPGTYEIELRHPENETVKMAVELKSGQEEKIKHDFTEEKE